MNKKILDKKAVVGYTYILASRPYGVLYTGLTRHLARCVWEHRCQKIPGFCQPCDVCLLVYYKVHGCVGDAYKQKRIITRWSRRWMINLIEVNNPYWRDLYPTLL